MLKKFGMRDTCVDTVCMPLDNPLLTLNTLFSLNVFKTNNFSVPIPMLLPTEIFSGMFAT